jgi:uncharacterized membrane protein YfcA
MLAHVIETATPGWIVLLAVSLLIAGLVKGVIGVGMPVVAFPLLSMLVDVQTAVMLLSVPLVLSNIPQALEGGLVTQTLRSLAPVLVGMVPGVWIGVVVLLNVSPAAAKIAAGAAVILVAALTPLAPKLQLNSDWSVRSVSARVSAEDCWEGSRRYRARWFSFFFWRKA